MEILCLQGCFEAQQAAPFLCSQFQRSCGGRGRLPPFLSDEFKTMLLQKEFTAIDAQVIYDKFDVDLMQEESIGVKKLFGLLCPLIDIMVNGKVLIGDELESSLHESLFYGLIRLLRK